jgi:starch synthase
MAAPTSLRLLQVSAELHPLLKTGGLADVTGALPYALAAQDCDTRVLLPGFPSVMSGLASVKVLGQFSAPWGESLRLLTARIPHPTNKPLHAYILDAPSLFDRPGSPYEDSQQRPYADNHRRFAALAWAAVEIAQGFDAKWQPGLVHAHDWHAGLVPVCLAHAAYLAGQTPLPTVFTIHNLAYQGLFPASHFFELGLPPEHFHPEGVEYWGQLSFMKAGLQYASRITTVSPTYAEEIQTPEFGCGLDGLLRRRQSDLTGILNGVNSHDWNPATDAHLTKTFDAARLKGKAACKAALQAELGLDRAPDTPLFTVVSRLTEQKGLPLVLDAVDTLVGRGAQLLILGNGDAALQDAFLAKAQQHAGQVAVHIGFDEALSHRVFAGSDVALVPSRFEPCGLTQMYALLYGSLPLVRRVGGLADTVVACTPEHLASGTATGFVFDDMSTAAFEAAVDQALALWAKPIVWRRVMRQGMAQAFSWDAAAAHFLLLYRELLPPGHSVNA